MPCPVCGDGTRNRVCSSCRQSRAKKTEIRAKKMLDNAIDEGRIPHYTAWNAQFRNLRFRPDFHWDMPHKVVILEIDENRHAGYCPTKEREREDAIRSCSAKPVLFHRCPELTEDSLAALVQVLSV